METVTASRILLCAENAAVVEDLRCLLQQEGHATGWHSLDLGDLSELTAHDLIVLESGQREQEALELCRRLRTLLADRLIPILLLAASRNPEIRLAGLAGGADVCLVRPLHPEELLAQVHVLLRLKKRYDLLAEKAAEYAHVQQQLQQSYRQLDQDLELAHRVQQSLLPRILPEMPPASFAVHYRPCGRVGGDCYDVLRLDQDHVGFYLADVVGHGLSASLLTIFLQQAIRLRKVSGRDDRLLPPHEVLQQLNRDLVEQAVADNPFITLVYALFDRRDGSLFFARAGHPHPIHVPKRGEPKLCQSTGTLLGVFETEFTTQELRLEPGDKLLLHSDGLDSLAAIGKPSTAERLLDLAERHAKLPAQEFVDQLSHDLLEQTEQPDDFTLLALEVRG